MTVFNQTLNIPSIPSPFLTFIAWPQMIPRFLDPCHFGSTTPVPWLLHLTGKPFCPPRVNVGRIGLVFENPVLKVPFLFSAASGFFFRDGGGFVYPPVLKTADHGCIYGILYSFSFLTSPHLFVFVVFSEDFFPKFPTICFTPPLNFP